jgi:hypothetical protein
LDGYIVGGCSGWVSNLLCLSVCDAAAILGGPSASTRVSDGLVDTVSPCSDPKDVTNFLFLWDGEKSGAREYPCACIRLDVSGEYSIWCRAIQSARNVIHGTFPGSWGSLQDVLRGISSTASSAHANTCHGSPLVQVVPIHHPRHRATFGRTCCTSLVRWWGACSCIHR